MVTRPPHRAATRPSPAQARARAPERGRLRRGRVAARLALVVAALGAVAVGTKALFWFRARAHLTATWRPWLGEPGPGVPLPEPIDVGGHEPVPLADDWVLFQVRGLEPGDYFGYSAAALGDVNGDDVGDFAVGAHQNENDMPRPAPLAGAGYVRVFSGADGSELYTLRPSGGAKIDGADDHFGHACAALGDLDGDGASEIAVGAYLFDAADDDPDSVDENTGVVFVFSGRTGELVHRLGGLEWGDRLGYALCSLPDRDGDGRPELVAGVQKTETREGVINAGCVQVVSTATWEPLQRTDGPGWEAHFGTRLITIDDVDGDGVREIVASASMYAAREDVDPERGAAALISGATGKLLLAFEGAGPLDHLGFSLAGLGDLDGDGREDVALGANQSGWISDFSGPGYVRMHSTADGRALAVLRGEQDGDQFGWTLVNVGDRDGDGHAELLVGAPRALKTRGPDLGRRGRLYLISGADFRVLRVLSGLAVDDQFGVSAALLDDLDGDGRREVLVGATENVDGQSRPGYAVVLSGRALEVR